jgi:hypothetical protein
MFRWDFGPRVLAAMRGPSSLRSFAACVSRIGFSTTRRSYRVRDSARYVHAIRAPRTLLDGWVDGPVSGEGEERRRLAIASGGRRESFCADEPADDAPPSAPGLLMLLRHSAPSCPDRPLAGGLPWRSLRQCAVRAASYRRRPANLGRGAQRSPATRWFSMPRLPTGYPGCARNGGRPGPVVPRRPALEPRRSRQLEPATTSVHAGSGHSNRSGKRKPRYSAVSEALCRTRTGDPFVTMAVGLVTGTPPEEPKYLHTLANGAPRAPAAQRSVQRAALPARYPDMPSRFGTGGRVVMEERQNLNLRPSGPQPERSG